MNVFEAISKRRSIRKFSPQDIDDNIIGLMLYMATQAPSAGNTQEWEFIVVKDPELKEKLAIAALRQDFVRLAPVVIVVCANLEKISSKYGTRGEYLYASQDIANATMLMMITATALGLGTCWVGSFDEDRVKFALDLPETVRPMVIVPVGYPDETPEQSSRMPFEKLTSFNKYGKKLRESYFFQSGTYEEIDFMKPIGDQIEEYLKDLRKPEVKSKKKLDFREFLKKLSR